MAASPQPLRVGLLIDSWRVPAWVHRVVEDVRESPWSELALVVLRRDPGPRPGPLARLWRRRRHLLYELYARLDRRLLGVRPDAFARRDLAPLLGGVPVLEVTPRTTRHSDRLEDADVAVVRDHRLDVLLRFGFRILRGEVLEAARHGVWSYHHGDSRVIRGGPPGFWEVMEGDPATGSVLQVLSERLDAGRALYRSWSPTHRRSVIRNRNHVYWKSAAFVGRCLAHLAEQGAPPTPAGEEAYRPYDGPLYRKPSNLRAASLLARFGARAAAGWLADRASRNQWFLAYGFAPQASEGAPEPEELFRLRPLIPPRDRFWADPFPVVRDGGWFVFFEDYRYAERRGHLRVLRLDPARGPEGPEIALAEPFHLSHPFLFQHRGEQFLVPESAAAGELRVYRSTRFPDGWTQEGVLLDLPAVDATLHREGDDWWLFANVAPEGSAHAHDELHLFHAADPLGPWRPVGRGPVKSDARSARPAGRLFRWRGDLYRPAQDCSRRYGSSIVLHRVLRLDRSGFEEEPVARIEPRWYPGLLATHTINREGDLTVVDGMIRRWPWSLSGPTEPPAEP